MKTLREYTEEKQSALFEQTGSFFAFGSQQFKEKRKEGVEYIDAGHNLVCPKSTAQRLLSGLNTIAKEGMIMDVEENGAAAIIQREYFNYETQISMDSSDVDAALKSYIDLFPELFTEQLMKETYSNCFNLAIENDWF